jgi:hypothetical protein
MAKQGKPFRIIQIIDGCHVFELDKVKSTTKYSDLAGVAYMATISN